MIRQRPSATNENGPSEPRSLPERLFDLATLGAILLLGFGIATYIIAGLYTRYSADDFCTASRVQEMGLWDAQVHEYTRWSGRFSAIFATDVLGLLDIGFVPFWSLVELGSLLLALTWSLVQIGWLVFRRRLVLPALVVAEACVLAYVMLIPEKVQSLYWVQGSATYTLPLIFFSLLPGVMARSLRANGVSSRVLAITASFALTLVAGGFSETFALWQFAVLVIAAIACAAAGSKELRRKLAPLLVAGIGGAVLAGAIIAASPGNANRQDSLHEPLPASETILKSLEFGRTAFRDSVFDPVVLLVLGIATVICYAATSRMARRETDFLQLAAQAILSLAAALILIVLTFAPGTYVFGVSPPPRALVTAQVSIVLVAAHLGYLAGTWLLPATVGAPSPRLLAVCGGGLLVLVALFALPAGTDQLRENRDRAAYASAWDQRHEQIKDAKRSGADTVSVKAIDSKGILLELSRSPSFWVNGCMADYYGLETVQRQDND